MTLFVLFWVGGVPVKVVLVQPRPRGRVEDSLRGREKLIDYRKIIIVVEIVQFILVHDACRFWSISGPPHAVGSPNNIITEIPNLMKSNEHFTGFLSFAHLSLSTSDALIHRIENVLDAIQMAESRRLWISSTQ